MKNLISFTLLCGTAALVSVRAALAQTPGQCAIAPTCGELGYEQTAADCTGQHMLKCPFDNSKVFCGGENCSYTKTSLPSGCSNAPSCTKGGKNYYSAVCSSCYEGYRLNSDGTCSKTCTYTNTSTSHCTSYDSCRLGSSSGNKTFYYCESCETGYSKGSGECYACAGMCSNHDRTTPYTDEECTTILSDTDAHSLSFECGGLTYYYCKRYNDLPCLP